MEQSGCDGGRENDKGFKCEGISNVPLDKSAIVGNESSEGRIVTFTPDKTNNPLHSNYKEGINQLPEKFKSLVELFDRLVCSLRLLSLRKKSPTFKNICTLLEVLTIRKFSYSHLAQMKHILPGALKIDKILIHDEKSLCMKPEISISLLLDVIEGHQEKSAYVALRHLFHMKILSFIATHHEDCDIPEAVLPLTSNKVDQMISPDAIVSLPSNGANQISPMIPSEALPADSLQTSVNTNVLSDISHQNSHIKRHFSSKNFLEKALKTELSSSPVRTESSSIDILSGKSVDCGQQKDCIELCSNSTLCEAPQLVLPQYSPSPIDCESPFVKLTSVVDPIVETPAQLTPKRSVPRGDDNVKSFSIKDGGTSGQKPTKRHLDFSQFEGGDESGFDSKTDGTQGNVADEIATGYPLLIEQDMPASLHETATLIHHIFESIGRSMITKEELIHKIIMNNLLITERREVEEQIEHLEKQVPDWICKRLTHGGDVLYNISKSWNLDRVHATLNSI